MEPISLETAYKIVEATSSIYQQGDTWVLRVWDLEAGAERLTRGLSHKKASTNLLNWRKTKVDDLMRSEAEQMGWVVQVWEENPTWQGAGLWQSAESHWHVSKDDAQSRLQNLNEQKPGVYELKSMLRESIPRHFSLLQNKSTLESLKECNIPN